METLKFGYKYFRKSMVIAVLAEILSFLGIFAELLLPLLSGILIDFVIQKGEVKEDSGGVFHFLLTGKYGEVHTMQLFFSIAAVYAIMILLRIVLIFTFSSDLFFAIFIAIFIAVIFNVALSVSIKKSLRCLKN